ncbi:MAG: T9SS type A sorting domain-containing protein [Bacteroidales bacterium]|nr:T9SS type A sorting domain-containing protein [Bacteroidales bacterium]
MKKLIIFVALMTCFNLVNAQKHWTPITGNQYNMDVKGKVTIDGVVQNVTTLEVGAFCGDECRASELVAMFPVTQEYLAMLTIRSNVLTGETITFRLYDHALGEELDLECESTVEFVNDAVIGTIGNWYEFAFTTPATPPTTNTGSGDWNDPSIWGGTEPSATANVQVSIGDVTIGDNGAVEVTVASLEIVTGATLTIESGSTLIVAGNLVNDDENGLVIEDGAQVINESAGVKATAHKNIQAWTSKDSNGWHLIASPVDGMTVAGSDFVIETYDLYRYDEPTATWENYRTHYNTDFLTFENGRGYLYANSNSGFSPAFTGDLNYTAMTYQVSFASLSTLKGFNLIGNPFPHNIYKGAGGAIDDSKLASGYYTLSYNGEWVTHTFEDVIAPGQGILVKTTAGGNITIAKKNAASTAETSSKDAARRLKISVSGNGKSDRAYVYFSDGVGLDKMDNYSSSAAQIAIRDGENDYAIAHVGSDCEEMDVIFKNTKNGYYTVTFEDADDFDYLHLIDNVLGIDTDMKQESYYKFHALGNEDENRFKVVCKGYNSVGEDTDDHSFAYITSGNIVVKGEGMLQIIDMTGRVVNTMNVNGVETIEKPSQNGVYVLRIVNGNDIKTQKIVVR